MKLKLKRPNPILMTRAWPPDEGAAGAKSGEPPSRAGALAALRKAQAPRVLDEEVDEVPQRRAQVRVIDLDGFRPTAVFGNDLVMERIPHGPLWNRESGEGEKPGALDSGGKLLRPIRGKLVGVKRDGKFCPGEAAGSLKPDFHRDPLRLGEDLTLTPTFSQPLATAASSLLPAP